MTTSMTLLMHQIAFPNFNHIYPSKSIELIRFPNKTLKFRQRQNPTKSTVSYRRFTSLLCKMDITYHSNTHHGHFHWHQKLLRNPIRLSSPWPYTWIQMLQCFVDNLTSLCKTHKRAHTYTYWTMTPTWCELGLSLHQNPKPTPKFFIKTQTQNKDLQKKALKSASNCISQFNQGRKEIALLTW
jgi:hypothetical protein